MLEYLEIRNFALIEHLSVDFSRGFNVITGETGAGKSIILGALGLLLGEKADSGIVRAGCDECVVAAVLSIPSSHPSIAFLKDRGIELDEGCINIRRVVKANGSRGLISIQGQSISRSELSAVTDSLIDMHSQHEHQSLIHSDSQRRILDSFAANGVLMAGYAHEYAEGEKLSRQRADLERKVETALKEKDYLEFAYNEIKKIDPKVGEEETIKEELATLTHFEMLSENLQLAIENLNTAKNHLFDASSSVSKAMKADGSLVDLSARLESIRIENEDLFETLRDRLSSMTFSQERVDFLQSRLSRLQKLRKYGKTIGDVLAYADEISSTLKSSENSEIELSKLDKQISIQQGKTREAADKLSASRKEAAMVLQGGIKDRLVNLGMPSASFRIQVNQIPPGPKGQDEIAFLIAPNKGEDLKMIAQIASGGELSRIMLAIKTVLAEVDDTQTQVFDEVDAGIGGVVAQAVALQLKQLSLSRQVISITHLASIASKAERQLVVSKHEENGRTFSQIRRVENEERVQEISRMLSGDTSEVSLEHARLLLG